MNKRVFANNQIRAREVRVIDETGKQLGVMLLPDALREARERGLDLIQVTEKVEPPVCKIMEYGKYIYQERKKQKGQKPKGGELKNIRLGFNISLHDMEVRTRQAEKFLNDGNKVRIELRLFGREKALGNFAKDKINQFLEILGKTMQYKAERELKREPRGFTVIISKT